VKYNIYGVQQWAARYNGPGNGNDDPIDIKVDALENVYVTGQSRTHINNSDSGFLTIKYNSSGIQQWVAIFGGSSSGDEYATSMAIDDSGNVFVTG